MGIATPNKEISSRLILRLSLCKTKLSPVTSPRRPEGAPKSGFIWLRVASWKCSWLPGVGGYGLAAHKLGVHRFLPLGDLAERLKFCRHQGFWELLSGHRGVLDRDSLDFSVPWLIILFTTPAAATGRGKGVAHEAIIVL